MHGSEVLYVGRESNIRTWLVNREFREWRLREESSSVEGRTWGCFSSSSCRRGLGGLMTVSSPFISLVLEAHTPMFLLLLLVLLLFCEMMIRESEKLIKERNDQRKKSRVWRFMGKIYNTSCSSYVRVCFVGAIKTITISFIINF